MDNKDQINLDLPPPPEITFSPEERRARTVRLICTAYVFVTLYSFLHKIIVPFALSFTPLYPGPYTKIDISFLLPAALTYILIKKPQQIKTLSFLAGAAIVYGALEILEVSQGRYVGWLSFSRLLSSVPIATLSLFTLTAGLLPRSAKFAWIGALSLLPLYYGKLLFPVLTQTEIKKTENNVSVSRTLPNTEVSSCGSNEVRLSKSTILPPASSLIRIESCGLSPSLVLLSNKHVQIKNSLQRPVNIHLVLHREGKNILGWNVLVPSGVELTRDIPLEAGTLALLYSDSFKEAGITVLSSAPVQENWAISRNPIRFEVTK